MSISIRTWLVRSHMSSFDHLRPSDDDLEETSVDKRLQLVPVGLWCASCLRSVRCDWFYIYIEYSKIILEAKELKIAIRSWAFGRHVSLSWCGSWCRRVLHCPCSLCSPIMVNFFSFSMSFWCSLTGTCCWLLIRSASVFPKLILRPVLSASATTRLSFTCASSCL